MPDARRRFEALLLPVRESLHRFALQLTRDPVRADDLIQQAVVVGLSRFDQLDVEPAFRAWMSRIVYRTHLNERKSAASKEDRADPLGDNVIALPGTGLGPDRQVDRQRLATAIAEALSDLPEQQARAIWLVDGQGFKYREVAEILDIPRGTAATLVARGRRTLQHRLRTVAEEQGVVR